MKNLFLLMILALSMYSAKGQNEQYETRLSVNNAPENISAMQNLKFLSCLITNTGTASIPAGSGLAVSCTNKDIVALQYLEVNREIKPGESYSFNIAVRNAVSDINSLSSFGLLVKLVKSVKDPVQFEYGAALNDNIRNFSFSVSEADLISVYPNPSMGSGVLNFSGNVNAELFSIDGKSLLKGTDIQQMDITSLPKGVYYLHLETKESTNIQKVIIN